MYTINSTNLDTHMDRVDDLLAASGLGTYWRLDNSRSLSDDNAYHFEAIAFLTHLVDHPLVRHRTSTNWIEATGQTREEAVSNLADLLAMIIATGKAA